MMWIIY